LGKTTNRLDNYYISPTATVNHLGGGGYFYNRRLMVIVFITDGFKNRFSTWVLGWILIFSKKTSIIFGPFAFWYKTLIIFE
jgi:hypothetical protein